MVSTRGIKLKFFVNERVLCYEPDPTKAKVLYDSKVLDVIVRKDQAGKKIVEYLIHFQGWNSSWDRRVCEEFVLKDTADNRQLQKDLAEKAQLQLGAYLYRKERKKHSQPKPLDPTVGSSEDGSSGSPAHIDTDDNQEMSSSSGDDSSLEDEAIEIDFVPDLKEILEADYYLINGKNRKLKLPAEPNVVTILEMYYRQYVGNQFCDFIEKPSSRYRSHFNHKSNRPKAKDIQKNIALCREVIDGLRIYFDCHANNILLYAPEKGPDQYITAPVLAQGVDLEDQKTRIKSDTNSINNEQNNVNIFPNLRQVVQNGFGNSTTNNSRRRTLRSNQRSEAQMNGNSFVDENAAGLNNLNPCTSLDLGNLEPNSPMAQALLWRLLPDYVYNQHPPPPCLVYGAIHFTRLFVKLPELLTLSSIPDNKMKIILKHVNFIIDFLNEHKEWYGDKYYLDVN